MKHRPATSAYSSFFLAVILLLMIATCSYTLNNDKRNYGKGDLSMEKNTVDSFDDAMIAKYDFNSWKDTVEGETIHFHKGFILEDNIAGWTVINKEIEIDPIPFICSDAKYWMENKGKKILVTLSICESNQIAHQTIFSSLKYISHPNPVLDPPSGWAIGDVYKCDYWARGNVYVNINDLNEPKLDKLVLLTINKHIDSLLTNKPVITDKKDNEFLIQCRTDTLPAQSMVEVLVYNINKKDNLKYHFIYTGGRITLKNNTFYYTGYESGRHFIELHLTYNDGKTLMSRCYIQIMKF